MERIGQWISLFFDGLPYSEEAARARGEIEKALDETAPEATPEELAAQYGSYEKLGALAGYSPEQAKAWHSTQALRDGKEVKKELRVQRRRAIFAALLLVGLPAVLLWAVYYAVSGSGRALLSVFYGLGLTAGAVLLGRRAHHRPRRRELGSAADPADVRRPVTGSDCCARARIVIE